MPRREDATCSIRSRNVLAPLDVVEYDHERPPRRDLSRSCGTPGDSSAEGRVGLDRAASGSPPGGLFLGPQLELVQHLDDRPVCDPFAVGPAAAPKDRRVDRSETLRGEAGLADAPVAGKRHQLATLLRPDALP